MKVCQTVIFLIFITLQDGITGILIHTATEGGSITVECKFSSSGHKRFFCKEKCEKGNILIETADDWAQSGRYSIHCEDVLYVSITQLEKSDSGMYRCSLNRTGYLESNCEFEIVVTEGLAVFKKEALFVLLLPFVLIIIRKKKTENSDDRNKRRNPGSNQTEVGLHEDCSPVCTPDSSIYQSLDPAIRDVDQIYSTLTQI